MKTTKNQSFRAGLAASVARIEEAARLRAASKSGDTLSAGGGCRGARAALAGAGSILREIAPPAPRSVCSRISFRQRASALLPLNPGYAFGRIGGGARTGKGGIG